MARYLLDTCILLDWATNPDRLDSKTKKLIADGETPIFVSAATAWEIAIKVKLGKLNAPLQIAELLSSNGFFELPITIAHTLVTHTLPLHHKDPFDRILIAQAQVENLILITRDEILSAYEIPILKV